VDPNCQKSAYDDWLNLEFGTAAATRVTLSTDRTFLGPSTISSYQSIFVDRKCLQSFRLLLVHSYCCLVPGFPR
jgi:hypothetical protein